MLINFFEEFPTTENLAKLKYIKWPTKLYLAAKNIKEFETITSTLKNNKNILEAIYWPILTKKEGYWISPFSKQNALIRLFKQLEDKQIPVMLDLELPTSRNPWCYVTELFHFKRNNKLIRSFIQNYLGDVYLCEYAAKGKILQWFGLHYHSKKIKIIKMLYNSVHNLNLEALKKELQQGLREFGDKYIVSYGTIAKGINSDEPILSPQQLEKDLRIAKEVGVKEVVVFRLGGLNKKYMKVLEKFV